MGCWKGPFLNISQNEGGRNQGDYMQFPTGVYIIGVYIYIILLLLYIIYIYIHVLGPCFVWLILGTISIPSEPF